MDYEDEHGLGPFEMNEEFEGRFAQPRIPPPGRRPTPRPRPRPRPRRPRVGPLYVGLVDAAGEPQRCEVVLVLDGFAASSAELEKHHEGMLSRLAAHLRTAPPRTVEVVALTGSSRQRSDGDLGDRRTEAVAARLRELLGAGASRTRFRRLARRTAGPARVEIRTCMD